MRRDWDLIRALLLHVEENSPCTAQGFQLRPGDTATGRHFDMMEDGGLITVDGMFGHVRLTWAGRDFLDTIRDPKVWAHCQKVIESNGGGLPSDLLRATAHMMMPVLRHEH